MKDKKKKTEKERCVWEPDSMKKAILAVVNDQKNLYKVAKEFNVPRSTLRRKIKNYLASNKTILIYEPEIGFNCVFTKEQEVILVKYIVDMEKRLFGFTEVEVRSMAYQLAEKCNIEHPFNTTERLAGVDWFRGFIQRHKLSKRKPENTSAMRISGFNKNAVKRFFELLKEIKDKFNIPPERIYNNDECGISIVPKCQTKIVAVRGRKQVGIKTSAERGKTVTVEMCASATGQYLPPMLIFPRVTPCDKLLEGAPPGAWAEYDKSGWMQENIFSRWFEKFLQLSGATKENPVLLIFDGHSSHSKNIKVIDLALENGVELLCLPPHCSHRMQPLDISVMKPLSTYYSKEVNQWQRQNEKRQVTLYQVFSLFGAAFNSLAPSCAIKGFEKSGIHPFNPNIFKEDDFAAAVHEYDLPFSERDQTSTQPASNPSTSETCQQLATLPSTSQSSNPLPSTSTDTPSQTPSQTECNIAINSSPPSQSTAKFVKALKEIDAKLRGKTGDANSSEDAPVLNNSVSKLNSIIIPDNSLTIYIKEKNRYVPMKVGLLPFNFNTASLSVSNNVKRPSRAGKAAILSTEEYRENLITSKENKKAPKNAKIKGNATVKNIKANNTQSQSSETANIPLIPREVQKIDLTQNTHLQISESAAVPSTRQIIQPSQTYRNQTPAVTDIAGNNSLVPGHKAGTVKLIQNTSGFINRSEFSTSQSSSGITKFGYSMKPYSSLNASIDSITAAPIINSQPHPSQPLRISGARPAVLVNNQDQFLGFDKTPSTIISQISLPSNGFINNNNNNITLSKRTTQPIKQIVINNVKRQRIFAPPDQNANLRDVKLH